MLEIRNLTKTYKGGKRAVDNLSLQVEGGDTGELTGGASLESVFMEVACDAEADSIS